MWSLSSGRVTVQPHLNRPKLYWSVTSAALEQGEGPDLKALTKPTVPKITRLVLVIVKDEQVMEVEKEQPLVFDG